jgi:hypothetical protein
VRVAGFGFRRGATLASLRDALAAAGGAEGLTALATAVDKLRLRGVVAEDARTDRMALDRMADGGAADGRGVTGGGATGGSVTVWGGPDGGVPTDRATGEGTTGGGETGSGAAALAALAHELGLPLIPVPLARLGDPAAAISRHAPARYGGRSLAEAAALAGAGPGATLTAPRAASGDGMATAAIAERTET